MSRRLTEKQIGLLIAQRDFYRRRYAVHGLTYSMPSYYINQRLGRPRPEIETLDRLRQRDAGELGAPPALGSGGSPE